MKKIDMTTGNVMKVITTLALPIMGGSLLQFTYNLVDMLWVGGLGSNAVASIGSSGFFMGLGYSINALVVIGTGIKTAHAIGSKNEKLIKGYINAGSFINLVLGLVYALGLILLGRNLIDFLNLNNIEVEKEAYSYLVVSAPMMFFTFFNLLYTRILNSFGNNKEALKISAIGIGLNIILDPIFIYGLNLGVVGAGIASLVANLSMFIIFLMKYWEIFKFKFDIGINQSYISDIIKLGFPMAFQRILFTLVNIALAKIIAVYGAEAIAAQKIGLQIESIIFMVIGGLNGAISSFVGQNYGAKKYKRIMEGYKSSLKVGIIYAFIAAVFFVTIPSLLVELFVRDEITVSIASDYLKIIALSQIFSAVEMISNGLFTGVGKSKIPATISIVFTVLRIPMALILVRFIGVNGIWFSIALSSVFKGIVAYVLYYFTVRREYIHEETNIEKTDE